MMYPCNKALFFLYVLNSGLCIRLLYIMYMYIMFIPLPLPLLVAPSYDA
jgi:hypothetical protein